MPRSFQNNSDRIKNLLDFSDDLIYENNLQPRDSSEDENNWIPSHIFIISSSEEEPFEEESFHDQFDTSSTKNIQICDEIEYCDSISDSYQSDSLHFYDSNDNSVYSYSNLEFDSEDYSYNSSDQSSAFDSYEYEYPEYMLPNSNSPVITSHISNFEGNQDAQDLVILESINRSRLYPKITPILIISIFRKLLYFYYASSQYSQNHLDQYSPINIPLSSKLRDLSPDELNYLKDKVKWALCSIISDISRVNLLLDYISYEKIDNLQIDEILNKNNFKVTKFKDLINVIDKTCTICFEEFKANHSCITLKCCHTFHSTCVKKWISMSLCCPVCRSKDINAN